jgi:hypothetical protein
MTKSKLSMPGVLLAGLLCWACGASTTMYSSYRPPKAEPLDMKGEKVAAVVMAEDQHLRHAAEDELARQITARGAQGIASYSLLPGTGHDEASARAALEKAQVKGVIVMRPKRVTKETYTPPETYSTSIYSGFWGGYYPYGWGTSWGAPVSPYRASYGAQQAYVVDTVVPGHTEIEQVVRVEILIYSLKQNQLVWVGETESTDPSQLESFVEELADMTAEELRRLWLVPG